MTRDVIGQAKGILWSASGSPRMTRSTSLRVASQTLNLKLHHVAERLAETGELPAHVEHADR